MTSITLHLWRESAPLSPFLRVWMRLTDYRQRAKNTTDYPQKEKKLPTTDSKTINRLATLSTFVFKKNSILHFLEVTKLNFDSSAGQTERIPVLLIQVHVHCYNQYQNHRRHTLKILPIYIFYWKGKGEKPNIFCFDGRHKSLLKYTTKRGYWMSLQSI